MQDQTINSALTALRKQIILGNLDGLAHVDTLMRLRGVPVGPVVRRAPSMRNSRLVVMDALRDGPKSLTEVAAVVHARRPGLTAKGARRSAVECLRRMEVAGWVRREGRVWVLAR